jgi:hypothetical protein
MHGGDASASAGSPPRKRGSSGYQLRHNNLNRMSPQSQVDRVVKKLLSSKVCSSKGASGCTAEEIQQLEASLGHPLPKVYTHFLKRCGNGVGEFLVGTDWEYNRLAAIQTIAKSLFSEPSCSQQWQSSWFAFTSHQGYQFLFFDCAEGSNPAVYHYLQSDAGSKQVAASFAEWFDGCVDDEIRNCRPMPPGSR